jgi:CubicO group peptidase (beta-lactamase class C family)
VSSIGSITKQFTAAAILKLEMQGKLRVSDPIGKYLPDVPPDKAGITIHHLLTHTAGFRGDFGGRDSDPTSRDDLVKLVLAAPLKYQPGERYEYSNEGYSLAGAIVERVSGQTYESFLSANLFKPAGMTSTGYVLPQWAPGRLARGYLEGQDWGSITEKGWGPEGPGWYLKANGGIHSTILDMYRWHLALAGNAILSNDAKAKYFTPYVKEGPNADSYYAYGWAVFTTPRKTKLIAHNGGNGVFFADFRWYADEHVVIYAHSNAEVSAIDVTNVVPAIVFGGAYTLPPAVVDVSPATVAAYAGTYEVMTGERLKVEVSGGRLTATPEGNIVLGLLNGLTPPGGARFGDVEARTKAALEASARRDYTVLQQALGDVPLERLTQSENRLWEQRRQRFGEFTRVEVVGSERRGPDVAVIARLVLERGSVLVRFLWDGAVLAGRQVVDLPPAPLLLAVSPTEFASFSLRQTAPIRLRFDVDAAKAVRSVTLSAAGIDVVAKKIE